jgi:Tfp pilus assembly protein PilN
MPQQINLLAPILLAPRRHFSAATLLQATGLLILAALVFGLWLQRADRRSAVEHEQLLARLTTERQSLMVAQAGLPAAADPAALQQQIAALRQGNAQRQALLDSLDGAGQEGRRHSDLLQLIARRLPPSVWVNELRWSAGHLELTGATLDTAVLRPWLAELRSHPLLKDLELQGLRVERVSGRGGNEPGSSLLGRGEAEALRSSPLPVWAFQLINAPNPPAAASAASR